MNRKLFGRLAILIVVILTLGLTAIASSQEGDDGADADAYRQYEELVANEIPERAQQAAEEYWTPERIAEAQPMPWPEPSSAGIEDGPAPSPSGPMQMMPGGLPDPAALELAQELYPDAWQTLEGTTYGQDAELVPAAPASPDDTFHDGYNYPPPFTRHIVNNHWAQWKYYPWITIGKLYFTVPGVGNSYCSGSVAVGRAVWTAGHCVYTPGIGWHTNVEFVPAASKRPVGIREPFGRFTAFATQTLVGWTSGNQEYDIGMVAVNDKSGLTISQWVGWLGYLVNANAKQHWHAFGYPSGLNPDYSFVCIASLSNRWDIGAGPDLVGMGCDMQYGSSGGPWLVNFRPYHAGAANYVNSVVSGSPDPVGKPLEFFGPYFGNGALNLYNWGAAQ